MNKIYKIEIAELYEFLFTQIIALQSQRIRSEMKTRESLGESTIVERKNIDGEYWKLMFNELALKYEVGDYKELGIIIDVE